TRSLSPGPRERLRTPPRYPRARAERRSPARQARRLPYREGPGGGIRENEAGSLQDGHSYHGYPLSFPDPPHSFIALPLHGDGARRGKRARELAPHLAYVRSDPRLLGDHGDVRAHEAEAGLGDLPIGLAQKGDRIGVLPASVGGGKQRADVPQPRGAQNRVGERMGHRVGVGMARKTLGMWDFHSSEDQLAAVGEAVRVVADADAHGTSSSAILSRERDALFHPLPHGVRNVHYGVHNAQR